MEKRRQALVDLINQLGEVSMTQLRGLFPTVSEVTLRKDLRVLDEGNKIVRIHGGAKSIQDIIQNGSNFTMRTSLHQEEKFIIAQKAAPLVHPGCSIYISAGSTCAEFARQLPDMASYIFTDGLIVAREIPFCPERYVEVFGGRLNQNLMRVIGPSVVSSIEKLHFDYAVLGAAGFHPDYGIPQTTSIISAIANAAISRADKVIILMDSSKINYIHSPWNIPLQSVDVIVTDDHLPQQIRELMESQGVTVL